MGNKKALFAVGTTALTAFGTFVACGSDKAKPDAAVVHDSPVQHDAPADAGPDAASYDFSCVGNSAPSPAANVTVAGTVYEVGFSGGITFGGLGSASVTLCKGNCVGNQNNLGSASTDGSGAWSIGPIATNGSAVDGYVRITHTGDRSILGYPAAPIAANITQPAITFQSQLIDLGGSQFGCPQQAGNGMLGVLITDCAGKPITDGNVVVHAQQNGSDVGDAPINASALSSMAGGFWLVCDIPVTGSAAGVTTVSVKYGNLDLLAHAVTAEAGTTTETVVRPGY